MGGWVECTEEETEEGTSWDREFEGVGPNHSESKGSVDFKTDDLSFFRSPPKVGPGDWSWTLHAHCDSQSTEFVS